MNPSSVTHLSGCHIEKARESILEEVCQKFRLFDKFEQCFLRSRAAQDENGSRRAGCWDGLWAELTKVISYSTSPKTLPDVFASRYDLLASSQDAVEPHLLTQELLQNLIVQKVSFLGRLQNCLKFQCHVTW